MLTPSLEERPPTITQLLADIIDDPEADPWSAGRRGEPADPNAETILVIDDDLANLALAEALLQAEGYRVRVAIDAKSMFAVLETISPSLILMDIQLPEIDGWELTRRLKADPKTRDIPVLAITAYGQAGDITKAREAGFADFLAKPVSTRELPGIIRRHLPPR
jgi:CheY-like chemotaxis protein